MNIKTAISLLVAVLAAGAACSGDAESRKEASLNRANRYFEQGKFQEAVVEYRNAIQIDARFAPARVKLAESYAHLGQAANALNEYVRSADLLPNDMSLQLTAGRYLLAARRFDEALARADAVLKRDGTNVEAHVLRGNALGGLNDFDRALGDIEEAIRLDPSKGTTYTHLGLVQLARGSRDAAEAAFKRAVALAPSWVYGHLALGNYYWAAGRAEEAERSFADALRFAPTHPLANRAMAALYIATGRAALAERYLKRIAEDSPSAAATLGLADYYQAVGRTKDAIAVLEQMAAANRNVAGASARLALAYSAVGERKKAHALVDDMLAHGPQDPSALLIKGKLLMDEGRREDAFEQVRSAVDADPASAQARYVLGKLYVSRGDAPAAEAEFREVLKLNPQAAAAQLELSRLQLASGRVGESLRSAEDAARSQPKNLDARLALARSLLAAADLTRAEREIRSLSIEYPAVAAVHVQQGLLETAKRNPGAARAAFERALALDVNSLDALAGLVGLHLGSRDLSGAKALIDSRAGRSGANGQLLLLAARTHAAAQDLAGAEQFLRRAIDADPALLSAYAMLAQVYLVERKLDQAREEFDRVAQRQAKPVAALTMSGMILQSQGNTAEARRRFERVVAIDSGASVAANNLAWILAESGGDLNHALELAQAATTTTPDVPEMMDTLGWVYYKKNLPKLAIPLFARCAEKAPENAAFLYHLGLAHVLAGDNVAAAQAFQRALAVPPDPATSAEIRRALSQLQPERRAG